MEAEPIKFSKHISAINFRLEWLKFEVEMLERKIELHDQLSVKFKNWTMVSWFALVSYSITHNNYKVAIFSPLIPLLFLIIDASYKRHQIDFIIRTRHIMKFLNDSEEIDKWGRNEGSSWFPVYDLLNIYSDGHSHDPTKQEWGSILTAMKKMSVSLPYIVLIIAGLLTSFLLFMLN